ncbi:MAG: BatA domain-containing protein, partial [Planctomycetales bacterium]|nr:BatA domain-containing protein [Planctomycetales bacterium]
MFHSIPLAFGFANLAILGWLAAAAAPLLIHLWMRRVRKETRWAAVQFLQAAIKRHARRLQLQQWILLAIRTAILLLVVLAAMKPLVDSLGVVGAGVRTHRLIVIDASLSMGAESADGRLIDRAKQLAAQLVDQSNSGDVFSVYLLSAPPQAALAQPTSDRARTKRAIGEIKLTDGSADLAQGLALLASALVEAESTGIRVDRQEVVFFTDLTATTWGALGGEGDDSGAAQEARQLYAKLIDQAELAVISVGAGDVDNTAVVALRIDQPAITTRQPVAVRAQVKAFGEGEREATVDLVVDNLTTDTKQITLAGGAEQAVEFAHQFHTPGVHELAVRIGEDKLPGDNTRYAAANVTERLRVLCVEGRRGAARYIARALNPSGQADAAIEPVVVSDAELSTIDFSQYRCVFFCNVAQLSRSEADRLRGYLQRGGGVVFFLGDQVAPERYNEILGGGKAEGRGGKTLANPAIRNPQSEITPVLLPNDPSPLESLLPVTIGPVVSDPQYRLDPLEYRHPLTAPFKGRERAGLITTPIARYYKLNRTESSAAQVALATTGGDPLVVTAQRGRGRVAVVATDGSLTSVDPATGEP